jgi:hypothetical protein
MLVAVSGQFPLLMGGECGLESLSTAVEQISPFRSPCHSE